MALVRHYQYSLLLALQSFHKHKYLPDQALQHIGPALGRHFNDEGLAGQMQQLAKQLHEKRCREEPVYITLELAHSGWFDNDVAFLLEAGSPEYADDPFQPALRFMESSLV